MNNINYGNSLDSYELGRVVLVVLTLVDQIGATYNSLNYMLYCGVNCSKDHDTKCLTTQTIYYCVLNGHNGILRRLITDVYNQTPHISHS